MMDRINKKTIKDAINRLQLSEGETYLEIGAGNGHGLAEASTVKLKRIVAVEISEQFRNNIMKREIPNLELYGSDAKEMSFLQNQSVDKLLAMNVIYFLDPLDVYIKEIKRVLKKDYGKVSNKSWCVFSMILDFSMFLVI